MKLISPQICLSVGLAISALTARCAVGTLSGPITHRNLQIFLVHGHTQLEPHSYATLSEALEKGFVLVKETGSVQELSIENVSKHTTVFVNEGHIVKAGRQ